MIKNQPLLSGKKRPKNGGMKMFVFIVKQRQAEANKISNRVNRPKNQKEEKKVNNNNWKKTRNIGDWRICSFQFLSRASMNWIDLEQEKKIIFNKSASSMTTVKHIIAILDEIKLKNNNIHSHSLKRKKSKNGMELNPRKYNGLT